MPSELEFGLYGTCSFLSDCNWLTDMEAPVPPDRIVQEDSAGNILMVEDTRGNIHQFDACRSHEGCVYRCLHDLLPKRHIILPGEKVTEPMLQVSQRRMGALGC